MKWFKSHFCAGYIIGSLRKWKFLFIFLFSQLTEMANTSPMDIEFKFRFDQLTPFDQNEYQQQIINERFLSKKSSHSTKSADENHLQLQQRVKIVIDQINELPVNIDYKYCMILQLITQNIHILKHALKYTYLDVPWEEMEFCLSLFLLNQKMDAHNDEHHLYYKMIINETFLKMHLKNFKEKLGEFKIVKKKDTQFLWISKKENDYMFVNRTAQLTRDNVIHALRNSYRDYNNLLEGFSLARNIHSLKVILKYINVSCELNLIENHKKYNQLVLLRTCIVIGEYIKNTTDSPNMSQEMSNILYQLSSNRLKDNMTWLRNSIIHTISFFNKFKEEKNSFYVKIQEDFHRIKRVLIEIISRESYECVKYFLRQILIGDINFFIDSFNSIDKSEIIKIIELANNNNNKASNAVLKEKIKNIKESVKKFNIKQIDKKLFQLTHIVIENENSIFLAKKNLEAIFQDLLQIKDVSQKLQFQQTDFNKVQTFIRKTLQKNKINRSVKLEKASFYIRSLQSDLNIYLPDDLRDDLRSYIDETIWETLFFVISATHFHSIYYFKIDYDNDECFYRKKIEIDLMEIKNKLNSETKKELFNNQLEIEMDNDKMFNELLLINKKEVWDQKDQENIIRLKSSLDDVKSFVLNKNEKITTRKGLDNYCRVFQKVHSYDILLKCYLARKKDKTETNNESIKNGLLNFLRKICDVKGHGHPSWIKELFKIVEDIKNNENEKLNIRYENHFTNVKSSLNHLLNNYKNLESEKYALEMLYLQLTNIIKLFYPFETDKFAYDNFAPIPVGINLRNYVAHGCLLDSTLPYDLDKTLFINAKKLLELCGVNKLNKLQMSIGNTTPDDINGLKEKCKTRLECINTRFQNDFGNIWNSEVIAKEEIILTEKVIHGLKCVSQPEIDRRKILQQILNLSIENKWKETFNKLGDVLNDFFEWETKNNMEKIITAAINFGNTKVLTIIFGRDNIHSENLKLHTFLSLAISRGNFDILNLIIETLRKKTIDQKIELDKDILYIAAKSGDLKIFRYLIDLLKHDTGLLTECIQYSDRGSHNTPLHIAVIRLHIDIVIELLYYDADLSCVTKFKWTPLHYAATYDDLNMMMVLLENKQCDHNIINASTKDKATALDLATKNGNVGIVTALLLNKSESNSLHIASTYGYTKVIDILMEFNPEYALKRGYYNRTIYHVLAKYGHTHSLKKVAERLNIGNFDIYLTDERWTPLHFAAFTGQSKTIPFLLQNSNVNATTIDGHTPLHKAVLNGHIKLVKLLLNANANINITSKDLATPIDYAVQTGHKEIFELLTKENLIRNNLIKHNKLSFAAQTGNYDIMKMLVDEKLDVNCVTKEGWCPIHFAVKNNFRKCVELLLLSGAEIQLTTFKKKHTPIHIVAITGSNSIFNLFKHHRPNETKEICKQKDNSGLTPYHLAIQYKHEKLMSLIENEFDLKSFHHVNQTKNILNVLRLTIIANFESQFDKYFTLLTENISKNNPDFIDSLLDVYPLLHIAIEYNRMNMLKRLFQLKIFKVNSTKDDLTIVQFVARQILSNNIDNLEILTILHDELNEKLFDLTIPYKNDKCNIIHIAALILYKDKTFVEFLNKIGHYKDIRSENNWTVFHFGVTVGNRAINKFVKNNSHYLEAKTKEGYRLPHLSMLSSNYTIFMKDCFYNDDPIFDVKYIDEQGLTPLHMCVLLSNVDGFTSFLKKRKTQTSQLKTIFMQKDSNGMVPIHYTLIDDKVLAEKYNIFKKSDLKFSPEEILMNKFKIFQQILQITPECVNVQDDDAYTPLDYASQNGLFDAVEALLENYKKTNIEWNVNRKPFYLAVKNGHLKIAQLLSREQSM